ncbi:MAG: efflux RND transporter periplasmic adaptor subunit [Fluviicola sp.]|nr:efflux RND transporter periplasmic adaptor subunit [Fluviicola sp.]
MIQRIATISLLLLLVGCSGEQEIVKPSVETITESIYASGVIKSEDQYQVFATVNGIVEKVFVEEGDTVVMGQPLFSLANAIQQLNNENALLTASFYDLNANQEKINDAQQLVGLTRDKMRNDSSLYARQLSLWKQNVGSKVELEQRELAFENSQNSYQSAIVKYNDLKRQLAFNSSQSKKNLKIAQQINNDYVVKSELNGVVYNVAKKKGELVSPQTPIAVVGNAKKFVLEMQVDEYDITQIQKGQQVIVSMDSYQGKTFEARVTRINPMMNERTKSFTVEAVFVKQPPVLFPNFSFEANIVLRSKKNALLIPRSLLLPGNMVLLTNGEKRKVTIGLKDYQKVEITSGLKATDELTLPEE